MSDAWEFYPCTIDDADASIFVNVAAAESIDSAAPSLCVRVRLFYKATYPNGFPMPDDYDASCTIEDALQVFADEHEDWYTGRITVAGRRDFFFYTSAEVVAWAELAVRLEADHGYDLEVAAGDDPEHRTYWDELYPKDDDWQVIGDLRVIANLKEHGDDGSHPRDVEHWAYFDEQAAAQAFLDWAAGDRFTLSEEAPVATDDGRYCARVRHHGDVDIYNISSHTIALRSKAAELGGKYDGWEVKIMKNENAAD